jgi:two-component system NarL family sensor kinase
MVRQRELMADAVTTQTPFDERGRTDPNGRGPDNSVRSAVDTDTAQLLNVSEDRFVVAFYANPTAMAITTVAEGRYVDINEAFERQMGYARAEICGRTSIEFGVWPTLADRQRTIGRLLREKTIRDQNAQFRTKAGRLIRTLYSAGLVTLDGTPCVLAAIADITAQKLVEDALRESEAKFRLLAETIQSGICICREDGTFCYFNPQIEQLTGYSADELRTMHMSDLVHPDSVEMVRARVASRWRGEQLSPRHEFKILTKSGETRWLDLAATVLEFEGRPAIVGTAFDITEKKQLEQQAAEHTALLQTLVANSPYGIMVGGKDHRIRFCNSAFQRIFQYAESEVVGRDPDDLIGLTENSEARNFSARVLGGEVVHATTVRRRKDGSRVDVEFHAVPLVSTGEFLGCFGIYQDISERIRSEARLRSLRDRLTRVQDEERAHIARELHDDIGQRLALLGIQLAELQKASRTMAPALYEQLVTSRRLTEEICADAQRISHRLHPSKLALLGLTKALSRLCESFAKRSDVEIEFLPGEMPRLPPEISTCLYRIAQEAIQNAAKHSQCPRIVVELSANVEAVRLSVSDTGCGFDSEAGGHKAGLGLVSMAERASSVGGDLSVRSAVNQGTKIEVTIPLRLATTDAAAS